MIEVRFPAEEEEHLDDIVDLYYHNLNLGNNTKKQLKEKFASYLKPSYKEHTLLALEGERVVGFVTWNSFDNLGTYIWQCRLHLAESGSYGGPAKFLSKMAHKSLTAANMFLFDGPQSLLEKKIRIERFEHDMEDISPDDVYVCHTVVDRPYRRQGIAKQLMYALREHLISQGVEQIFFHAREVAAKGARQYGVQPIVYFEPARRNGEGASFMGMKLRP